MAKKQPKLGYDSKKNTWTGHMYDEMWGSYIGIHTLINIHDAKLCAGRACVMHNPSDHHMREWRLSWRGDKRVFERSCLDHGIGHPDPDDAKYLASVGRGAYNIHGCDGCCRPSTNDKENQ